MSMQSDQGLQNLQYSKALNELPTVFKDSTREERRVKVMIKLFKCTD